MTAAVLASVLYLVALAITAAAAYLIYRQNLSSYRVVRDFLLGVYALVFLLLLLELWRVVDGSTQGMHVYAPLSIGIGLTQAVFLACAAVGLYIRPVGSNYRTFLHDLRTSRLHTALLLIFAAFSVSTIVYVAIFTPYTVGYVSVIGGGQVLAVIFPTYYILLLAIILFFFLCYPTVTLLVATHRIPNKLLSSSLLSLPVGWAGSTITYVLFESIIWVYGTDATGLMYVANAVLFFFVTRNFRNAAVLAGMVVPSNRLQGVSTSPLGTLAGLKLDELRGMAVLLDVHPSSGFEDQIRSMISTFSSAGKSVFVFTSRGGRVNQAVGSIPGVKLYLMTASVSYYKAGERENEVLLSSENTSVMLDAFGKSAGPATENESVVFFDSLSDLILSLGFKESYKFLKAALEVSSNQKTTSLFVMLSGAHENNVENSILSRFPIILAIEGSGIRVIKSPY